MFHRVLLAAACLLAVTVDAWQGKDDCCNSKMSREMFDKLTAHYKANAWDKVKAVPDPAHQWIKTLIESFKPVTVVSAGQERTSGGFSEATDWYTDFCQTPNLKLSKQLEYERVYDAPGKCSECGTGTGNFCSGDEVCEWVRWGKDKCRKIPVELQRALGHPPALEVPNAQRAAARKAAMAKNAARVKELGLGQGADHGLKALDHKTIKKSLDQINAHLRQKKDEENKKRGVGIAAGAAAGMTTSMLIAEGVGTSLGAPGLATASAALATYVAAKLAGGAAKTLAAIAVGDFFHAEDPTKKEQWKTIKDLAHFINHNHFLFQLLIQDICEPVNGKACHVKSCLSDNAKRLVVLLGLSEKAESKGTGADQEAANPALDDAIRAMEGANNLNGALGQFNLGLDVLEGLSEAVSRR